MRSKARALAMGLGVALVMASVAACGSSGSPGGTGGAPVSLQVGWPADWGSKVPAPDGCTLGSATSTSTYLNITCAYSDTDAAKHVTVLKDYQKKLVDGGFTLVSESSEGAEVVDGIGMFQVKKESLTVTVVATNTSLFTINVMTW